MQEESLQISELTEMEKAYAAETISFVKQLIEPLGTSFHIKPSTILKSDSTLQDVVLTPQGVIFLMFSSGVITSRPLENVQTETLVKILTEILPELNTILGEKRQRIAMRVGILERMAREFRKVVIVPSGKKSSSASSHYASFTQSQHQEGSSEQTQDAMKSSLTGQ